MASASAPANELASKAASGLGKQPSCDTSGSKHSSSGGSVSRGRDPGLAAAAAELLLLRRVQASSPAKKTERKDHMHQVFISSYLPIIVVFLLLPLCFLVICRRYFVCTYSCMG